MPKPRTVMVKHWLFRGRKRGRVVQCTCPPFWPSDSESSRVISRVIAFGQHHNLLLYAPEALRVCVRVTRETEQLVVEVCSRILIVAIAISCRGCICKATLSWESNGLVWLLVGWTQNTEVDCD